MATFFKKFPTVDMKYNDYEISYTDIYRFVDVNELNLPSYTNYLYYEIADGERPEQVSYKLYNVYDFYWTFFIVNDRLKAGMSEWPLQENALSLYIANKYDKYGVCSIYPYFIYPGTTDLLNEFPDYFELDALGLNAEIDLMEDLQRPIAIGNFLQGLDLSHEWLRVKRVVSNQSSFGAKIKHFDGQLFQLWVEDVQDSFFFDRISSDIPLYNHIQLYLENPYEMGTDEYAQVNAQNQAWIESTRGWYTDLFGEYNGLDYQADLFDKLRFKVREFYETGSIAPHHYIDGVTKEKVSDFYSIVTGVGEPVPNFEYERELNNEKRFIRVLNPESIRGFSEEYHNTLIESGRLSA